MVFSGTGDYAGDGGSIGGVYLTTGTTTRVSPQTVGDNPVAASAPTIDRNGAKVLYATTSALDPSDTNATTDLYLRDLSAGSTVLVTANHAGTGAGDAESFGGALSANGRYAGFYSSASDLVERDTNGNVNDVFLRDLTTGRTTLVTSSPAGDSGNSMSWNGIPSGDGSRVVFTSAATNLGAGPGDGRTHLFLSCLRNCL